MKINKKAFTLAEVLVVLTVIGIVMAISVKTLKMLKASYTPLAYYANRTVTDLANIFFSTTLSSEVTLLCRNSDGNLVRVLIPDGYTVPSTTPNCSDLPAGSGSSSVVCEATVSKVVNTSGKTRCNSLFAVDVSGTEPAVKNLDAALTSTTTGPTFTATNGQRYYLTHNYKPTSNTTYKYGFRLLAVDLNGKRTPNSSSTSNNKVPPDTVTFMIMDNGEVFPLGVAADNFVDNENRKVSYISANLKGYCYPDSNPTNPFYHCPVTSAAQVPAECFKRASDGSTVQVCNYLVERPANIMTYRNAYCTIIDGYTASDSLSYSTYCNNAGISSFREACPPTPVSQKFDMCKYELVKPIFRFNFN